MSATEFERARAKYRQLSNGVLMACGDLMWATDGTPGNIVRQVEEVVRRWRRAEALLDEVEKALSAGDVEDVREVMAGRRRDW